MALPGRRRLRFAPSPTGDLHIGNVRTALLSYCLAGEDGRFLVRIEDTDRERYQPESIPGYLETLAWLGLHWDEGPDIGGPCAPYTESERLPYFRAAAERLVASGSAYFCFCTKERLDDLRAAQRTAGLPTRYDGHCRTLTKEEVSERRESGEPSVVRLLVPHGETRWDDLVLGPQLVDNESVDDQVLLKSDGFPTYHLAQVVDDHLMGITEVVRAVEWLPSTPKHLITYAALGWQAPRFAHVALVLGPDHSKLSKRHGAQSVGEFIAAGYLPEAVRNYLARLGWGHGDDEIFDDAQAIAWFDVADVVRAPARLDWNKLAHVNSHYIRQADDARLADLVLDVLRRRDESLPPDARERLIAAIPMVKEGAKTLVDLADLTAFALKTRPLALDDKTLTALTPETRDRLRRLEADLTDETDWRPPALALRLRAFAEAEGVGLGKIGPALRGGLSGGSPAPDLAGALAALGREESLGRISDALSPPLKTG